ncbi:MAG: hypothetical protein JNM43_21555, partial [Planctomycetaceae bacterium]|nr:hypothetical protein [Planctomycetaceae bacterium]
MLISAFLKSIQRFITAIHGRETAKFHRARTVLQGRRYRRSEFLEPRQLLSAVQWDGGAGTTNWDDALNWDTDAVPTASDDVTVSSATVSISSSLSLNSLSLNTSQLLITPSQVIAVNQLFFSSDSQIDAGTGALTIRPSDSSRMLNLGGDDSATELGISDAELDQIVCSTLTLGSLSGGAVSVTAPISATPNLALLSGDAMTIGSSIELASNRNLTIESTSTVSGISLNNADADLTTTGTGAISLVSARNIYQTSDSTLTTVDGGITLNGNLAGAGAGAFTGVELLGSVITTGSGPIVLRGRGGSVATAELQRGVVTYLTAYIASTAANNGGSITVNGTGGSGTNLGIGVDVTSGAVIDSMTGAISITGTGAGTGYVNLGVSIYASSVISRGLGASAAPIAIIGTGTGLGSKPDGTSDNDGVRVSGVGSSVTSIDGSISITGHGGEGSLWGNRGIGVFDGIVAAAGLGNVGIFGTGGFGTADNCGVFIYGVNAKIGSVSGDVLVQGQGGTGVDANGYSGHRGVLLAGGSRIESSGNGTITVNGTGDGTGTGSAGVLLIDSNTGIISTSTGSGDIFVNGIGSSTGGNGATGSTVINGARIRSEGTGSITFAGRAGSGSVFAHGAEVWGTAAEISSVSGPIVIDGTGGGVTTGTFNRGVNITNGGKVSSTGTATVTITGVGGNGSNSHAIGMSDGTISLTGTSALTLLGDSISLEGTTTITAGANNVTLGPKTAGRLIDLGTDDTTTSLGLTDAELDRITTTGVLQVGTLPSGTIRVTAPVSASTYSTMKLTSNGGITQTGTGSLTVTSLALTGGAASLATNANSVATLAASVASLDFLETNALTVGTVNSLNGATTTLGDLKIRVNAGSLVITDTSAVNDLSASGAISLTTAALDAAVQINAGADAKVTNGNITISADKVILNGTLTATGRQVTLQPFTSARSILVGSSTDLSSVALEVSDAELDRITAGTIQVGNSAAGAMTISGTIQAGTGSSHLVFTSGQSINLAATVTTVSGNLTFNANVDGLASSLSTGIVVNGLVQSFGTGSVTLFGRASGTTGTAFGVDVPGRVLSAGGTISITGYGAPAAGSVNTYGVNIRGAGRVSGTGTAGITVTGFGGLGTFGNEGVIIWSGGQVTAVDGPIVINGTGGGNATGTSTSNNGITLFNSGVVETTGNGSILLDGKGGTGSASFNGVGLSSGSARITSVNGNITVIGRGSTTAQTTGNSFHGVAVGADSWIESLGTGQVSVNGTGGSQGTSNMGVLVNGSTARISAANGSLNVSGTGGTGTGGSMYGIYLPSGTISSTGTAPITLTGQGGGGAIGSNAGIDISNSFVTTTSGSITIQGTSGTLGNNNVGMRVQSNGAVTTVSGNVTATGRSLATGGSGQHGLWLLSNGSFSTSGTGNIDLTGLADIGVGLLLNTGANVRSTSTAVNAGTLSLSGRSAGGTWGLGIDGIGTDTFVRSVNGDITIVGDHSSVTTAVAPFVHGVVVWRRGIVESTGTARITINGAAGRGTTGSYGVVVSATGSAVRSTAGDIQINGTGGIGSPATASQTNIGVRVEGGAIVQSIGTANLTIHGTGGSGSNNNAGVSITDSGSLVSVTGAQLTITGTGGTGAINAGSSPNNSYGIEVINSGRVSTANGTTTIVGTGGSGTGSATGNNHGVFVSSSGAFETTGSGLLHIQGTGGSGSSNNVGVVIAGSAQIRSTLSAAGNVQIDGWGGNGSGGFHHGISIAAASAIVAGVGRLSLTGIGGQATGAGDNRGISVTSSGVVQVASGNLALTGTGGSGTNSLDGIYLSDTNTRVTATAGNALITLTGLGGTGTGANARGVVVRAGAKVSGKNDVIVNGTGGSGSSSATGILITDSGTDVSSQPTSFSTEHYYVSLTGTGGTGPGGFHHGVVVTSSASLTSSLGVSASGIEGSEATSLGLSLQGGGLISGGFNGTRLIADSMQFDTSGSANVTGGMTQLYQRSAGTLIELGGNDRLEYSGRILGLTDSELDRIQTSLSIGKSSLGAMSVTAPITFSPTAGSVRLWGFRDLSGFGSLDAPELYIEPMPMSTLTSTS